MVKWTFREEGTLEQKQKTLQLIPDLVDAGSPLPAFGRSTSESFLLRRPQHGQANPGRWKCWKVNLISSYFRRNIWMVWYHDTSFAFRSRSHNNLGPKEELKESKERLSTSRRGSYTPRRGGGERGLVIVKSKHSSSRRASEAPGAEVLVKGRQGPSSRRGSDALTPIKDGGAEDKKSNGSANELAVIDQMVWLTTEITMIFSRKIVQKWNMKDKCLFTQCQKKSTVSQLHLETQLTYQLTKVTTFNFLSKNAN